MTSSSLLRRVAFLGGTPLGNSVGSIPSVLALTNSVIRRDYHEKVWDCRHCPIHSVSNTISEISPAVVMTGRPP